MNIKNILVGLLTAALVGLGGWTLHQPTQQAPKPVVAGSVTSPEITENHISVNGVTTWTLRQNMAAATTSLCSFPNPAGLATSTTAVGVPFLGQFPGLASSTLVSMSVQITGATSSDMTFDISTSTTPYATSTRAFMYATPVTSGLQFSGNWLFGGTATSSDVRLTSNMPVIGGDQYLVKPAEFVNVKTAGAGLGGYTYGGQCIAVFRSLGAF